VRPQEWIAVLSGMHILDVVTGFTILLTLGVLLQKQWKLKSAPQHLLILGFFFAILMSHVRHGYFWAFTDAFNRFGKVVLLYFLIVINVNSLKRLRTLIGVMIIGCLFLTLHGILQKHTGSGFGGQIPMWVRSEQQFRVMAFGFLNDPNDLALMLVAFLPFVMNPIHAPGVAAPKRLLNIGFVLAICSCILYTNSRGGWLALGTMVIAYCLINFASKKTSVIMSAILIFAVVIVAPSRMGKVSTREGSARGRLVAWAYGNDMLKRWPVFGAGYRRYTEFSEAGLVAHNSFVHCYAELGLFGYFFWLALIISSAWDSHQMGRFRGKDPPEHAAIANLARTSLSALIGYMAAAFFLSRTYTLPLYVLIAIFAILRTLHDRDCEPDKRLFAKRNLKHVLVLEGSSIIALYIVMRIAM